MFVMGNLETSLRWYATIKRQKNGFREAYQNLSRSVSAYTLLHIIYAEYIPIRAENIELYLYRIIMQRMLEINGKITRQYNRYAKHIILVIRLSTGYSLFLLSVQAYNDFNKHPRCRNPIRSRFFIWISKSSCRFCYHTLE